MRTEAEVRAMITRVEGDYEDASELTNEEDAVRDVLLWFLEERTDDDVHQWLTE